MEALIKLSLNISTKLDQLSLDFEDLDVELFNLTLEQRNDFQAVNDRLDEKCENISAQFAQQKAEYTELYQQQANNTEQLEQKLNNTINEQERECKQLVEKQAEQQENDTAAINQQLSYLQASDGKWAFLRQRMLKVGVD